MASIHVPILEVSALHEPSMFSPQIQGYHRLAGNQICGSSESAGKTLRSWSQCGSRFWRLPLSMNRLRIKHRLVTGNLSLVTGDLQRSSPSLSQSPVTSYQLQVTSLLRGQPMN